MKNGWDLLDRILPSDIRGWLMLGIFSMMVLIFTLIATVDKLDESQLFTALASGIVGSSFGTGIGYYFATTKGNTDNRAIVQSALDLASSKGQSISVEPPATIKVEDDVRSK